MSRQIGAEQVLTTIPWISSQTEGGEEVYRGQEFIAADGSAEYGRVSKLLEPHWDVIKQIASTPPYRVGMIGGGLLVYFRLMDVGATRAATCTVYELHQIMADYAAAHGHAANVTWVVGDWLTTILARDKFNILIYDLGDRPDYPLINHVLPGGILLPWGDRPA